VGPPSRGGRLFLPLGADGTYRLLRGMPMRLAGAVLIALVLTAGCQRAGRYGPRPAQALSPRTEQPSRPGQPTQPVVREEPLNPNIQWIDPGENPPPGDVLIEFVHAEKSPEEWQKLPGYWNAPPLADPGRAASLIGLPPLAAGPLASAGTSVIKIKVPLGLADPTEEIPQDNTLTLGKWQLGRRLFFDDSILEKPHGQSCATCHQPEHGFADSVATHADGFNTPTLANCVFNRYQFWDGRVVRLEEVIQRTLEDERIPAHPGPFHHVWHGVIGRLRDPDTNYNYLFTTVFGTPPTQNNVGQAIACYLRTLLAGNSVHDRAVAAQARRKAAALEPADYQTALTEAMGKDKDLLRQLGRAEAKPADLAAELHRGYQLFANQDERRQTNCLTCHLGRNFTDGKSHNIGVGFKPSEAVPGHYAGRFAHVPIGQKDRYLIEAYKTPTLRGLLRTGPYFHNGQATTLREVVEFFDTGGRANQYMDREMFDAHGRTRQLGLSPAEMDALVLFLRALNGDDVDDSVKRQPTADKKAQ
jgi:cytochrome c peroxidase